VRGGGWQQAVPTAILENLDPGVGAPRFGSDEPFFISPVVPATASWFRRRILETVGSNNAADINQVQWPSGRNAPNRDPGIPVVAGSRDACRSAISRCTTGEGKTPNTTFRLLGM